MENDTPLKWKLKLTVELAPGKAVEHDVTEWKRGGPVDLASLGLSMDEGKAILAEIQTQMVAVQVKSHGQARRCCVKCGRSLPNKGHYRSTFRSVYGNVPVQVQRVKACRGCGPVYAQVLHGPGTPLLERQTGGVAAIRESGGVPE